VEELLIKGHQFMTAKSFALARNETPTQVFPELLCLLYA